MCERRNTIACSFDPVSPRITAFDIHEWIYTQSKIAEHSVSMIQIDGTRRQVFIKFTEQTFVHDILHVTNGTIEYKHTSGEISIVRLEIAGMGTCRVRLANLPLELPNSIIRTTMASYGTIQNIQDENWPRNYRYTVANGIRIATMTLNKHLPSHIAIAGYRTLISYYGQPQTFYGCGDTDHIYQTCSKRGSVTHHRTDNAGLKWARRAADGPSRSEIPEYRTTTEATPVGKITIQPSAPDNVGTGVEEPVQEPLPLQVTDEQGLV
jgi:hypothetical protein